MSRAVQVQAAIAYAAAAIVLGGVLFAWKDPMSSHVLHAMALLLGAGCLLTACVDTRLIPGHWLLMWPLGAALWGVFQTGFDWTVYSFETWNAVDVWLARAAMFQAAYAGFRSAQRQDRLLRGIAWFGGAYALLAMFQWYAGNGTILWLVSTGHTSQAAGTFLNRDHFAAFMELLLPVALALSLDPGPRPALPYAVCSGVMFASVIASSSRAGALIVTCEVLIFLVLACRSKLRLQRMATVVIPLLLVCTLAGGWSAVWQRLTTGDPFASRREMLVSTVAMVRARPLSGFGLGTWPSVYPQFAVFDPPGVYMNHAHNDWAEWASEGGIPFATLTAIFAAAALWLSRRCTWALGIAAVFAHAAVDFPLQKSALGCAVFFLTGVAVAAAQGLSLRSGRGRQMRSAANEGILPPSENPDLATALHS